MTARRRLTLALVLGAGALAAAAAAAILAGLLGPLAAAILGAGALGVGAIALGLAQTVAGDHFRALETLRGDVVVLPVAGALPPRWAEGRASGEVGQFAGSLARVLGQTRATAPDARLAAVLATAGEGLVVITGTGLVSLVNGPAAALLGAERGLVGTSVFDALPRAAIADATARAHATGGAVNVELTLPDGSQAVGRVAELAGSDGWVLALPAPLGADAPARCDLDLTLHDLPAEAPVDDATPLAALRAVVVDTETTGLEVARDRIVAFGAVRLLGTRIDGRATLDRLVNPGVPIPAASRAVHGITDAMVAGAAPLDKVLDAFETFRAGAALVGHNLAFDLALLRHGARRGDFAWQDPLALDTALLVAALDPALAQLDLGDVAEHFGVAVLGRHTALGDALVTAEVYVRLVPRLAERGVTTLGQARDFALTARPVLAMQRRAGWWATP